MNIIGEIDMGSKSEYGDKLRHPLWQKKRLQILERASWRCSSCDSEDKTLHVHHLRYTGENPWDTADEFLECLCEVCHERREEANRMLQEMFREAPTREFDRFARNVTGALRIFETAPEHMQRFGAANFVLKTFNIATEKFLTQSTDIPPEQEAA